MNPIQKYAGSLKTFEASLRDGVAEEPSLPKGWFEDNEDGVFRVAKKRTATMAAFATYKTGNPLAKVHNDKVLFDAIKRAVWNAFQAQKGM